MRGVAISDDNLRSRSFLYDGRANAVLAPAGGGRQGGGMSDEAPEAVTRRNGGQKPSGRGGVPKSGWPNLYLVGFMGSGKSTIGRAVAQQLGKTFVDSDKVIEEEEGRSIPAIFAAEGEPYFREREQWFVREGHAAHDQVVACGGGLITIPGMRDALRARGIVVCLYASLETIIARTSANRNRPLLAVDDPADRVRTLYAQREPLYREAGVLVSTEGRTISEVAHRLARIWREQAAKA